MRLKRLTLLGATVAVLAATTALASIGPAGPVIPVNTDTDSFDLDPDVAAQPGGSYAVVWSVGPPDDSIRFRRFDSADQPLTAEKFVSTTGVEAEIPAMAAAPDGSLVVAWESTGDDAVAQLLNANGDTVGSAIPVPESATGINGQPDVAVAADGTFVVVWAATAGVRARRFAANGTPLTGTVDVGPGDASAEPSVTIDSAGRVFVGWTDNTDITARIRGFTAALAAAWDAQPVITGSVQTQEPDVVATPEGFVVVFNQADMANQAYGRRFTPAGAPVAGAVLLSPADGRRPNVARGADGALIASWWNATDGQARAFRSDLTAVGDPIVMAAGGDSPKLAAFSGDVVATYHANGAGTPDVFARRAPYDVGGAATPTPSATAAPTASPTAAPTTQPPAPAPVTPATPATAKKPTLNAFATLPSNRRCVSRRKFRIRLRHPRGARVLSAVVRVNGKRVATRRGARITAPVNLRGLPKGRFTVRITVKLADGRTVSGTRRYRTCTPKKRR